MGLFLGSKGGDILSWRETSDLLESIRSSFVQRAALLQSVEEKGLLRALQSNLSEEIAYEEQFFADICHDLAKLEEIEFEDQLAPLTADFYRTISDYFQRRGSVVALQSVSTSYFDSMIRKSIRLAQNGLLSDGLGEAPAPYCWLVSANAGREEQSFDDVQRHVLVYEGAGRETEQYFDKLGYRVTVILKKAGILGGSERQFLMRSFWCGNKSSWHDHVNEGLPQSQHDRHIPLALATPFKATPRDHEEICEAIARIADLRPLTGDEGLHDSLEEMKREIFVRCRESNVFNHVARLSAMSPVALGMFGWFKVERSGKHRGEFDLEQFALNPLIANIRLLAVKYGVLETGTIKRVRELLSRGHLNVDIAEKVLLAYHEIARQKIFMQIRGEEHSAGQLFFNPEELPEAEALRFKSALETVSTLQRIVHSDFMEHT